MGAACCSEITQGQYSQVPTRPPPNQEGDPRLTANSVAGPCAPAVVAAGQASGGNPAPGGIGGLVAPQAVVQDGESEVSGTGTGGMTEIVDAMDQKGQKEHAKQLVKEFVKEMVKGRKMNVMTQTGKLKPCTVSLGRDLNCLNIKAGGQKRTITLKDIEEICPGAEAEGINTPVDELCATLMLASEDCITFRMEDINSRDTFVMCLLIFCNSQK